MTPPADHHDEQQLSDAAVLAKTGKTWPEWFAILDAVGAEFMDHRQIVAYLSRAHVVSPWWQQMVTVTYEQERISRLKQSHMEDFQVSASQTYQVAPARVFEAWSDENLRKTWLVDDIVVERSIPERALNGTWCDGETKIEVEFYMRLDGTSQVVVQHSGFQDSASAEAMRKRWAEALDRLKAQLET